jgi:hypothetical protein
MRSVKLALELIAEEGWNPPWMFGQRGWCIHDALLQSGEFDSYIEATAALSGVLGEDVMLWEREPGRSEEDVVELFEWTLAG